MSTITGLSLETRSSLLRPIVLGTMFIFISQLIHSWIVPTLIRVIHIADSILRQLPDQLPRLLRLPVHQVNILHRLLG